MFVQGGGHPRRFRKPRHGLACDRPLDATEALPRPRYGADWHMPAVTCQVISSPPIHPSIDIDMEGCTRRLINYHRRRAGHESDRSSCCCYLDQTDSELSDAPTTRVTNYREPLGNVFNGRPTGRRTPMFQVRLQGPTLY